MEIDEKWKLQQVLDIASILTDCKQGSSTEEMVAGAAHHGDLAAVLDDFAVDNVRR
eukprot:CAMPEP_0113849860 /NCGR_PEP_ID=MMETSP0372-20130328/3438_1 /TAXON_ID=340204 /ORGANISM="Lankesteria abbotti" /LENGTH=55 /DNA_ID=CAMNT_0000819843 /DNA_START=479 /DNA_END=646 /DNA_ORIENTATION=- /assembly_acc=CAM_ASM_000359